MGRCYSADKERVKGKADGKAAGCEERIGLSAARKVRDLGGEPARSSGARRKTTFHEVSSESRSMLERRKTRFAAEAGRHLA